MSNTILILLVVNLLLLSFAIVAAALKYINDNKYYKLNNKLIQENKRLKDQLNNYNLQYYKQQKNYNER